MAVNTPGMRLVHRVFRAEFHDAVELIEGVRAGRLARARVVGNLTAFMLAALQHHDAAEHELVQMEALLNR
jgi:hypothetical protein